MTDSRDDQTRPPAPSCDVCGRLVGSRERIRTYTRTRRKYLVIADGVDTRVTCSRCASQFQSGGWREAQDVGAPAATHLFVMRISGFVFSWLSSSRPEEWERDVRRALEEQPGDQTTLAIIAGRAAPRWWLEADLWEDAVFNNITRDIAQLLAARERLGDAGFSMSEDLPGTADCLIALAGEVPADFSTSWRALFYPERCYTNTTTALQAGRHSVERNRLVLTPGPRPPVHVLATTDAVPLGLVERAGPFSAFCRECRRYHRDETLLSERHGTDGCAVSVAARQRKVWWPEQVKWSCPQGHALFQAYREIHLPSESSPIAGPAPRIDIDALLRGGR